MNKRGGVRVCAEVAKALYAGCASHARRCAGP
nr:MAG TPA: hypothetical protein [Caudoviricetes sp.]